MCIKSIKIKHQNQLVKIKGEKVAEMCVLRFKKIKMTQ